MPRQSVKVKLESASAASSRRKVFKTSKAGMGSFKNRQASTRQRLAWEKIQKEAEEQRAMPTAAFEVFEGTPVKSFFNPQTGKREQVEIGPSSSQEPINRHFRGGGTGFSNYPSEESAMLPMWPVGTHRCNVPQQDSPSFSDDRYCGV